VADRKCSECVSARSGAAKRQSYYQLHNLPQRREGVTQDWTYLTEAQVALWYMTVDRIRRGTQKTYRHHPLEERAVFLKRT
jgi:hypothetical protein